MTEKGTGWKVEKSHKLKSGFEVTMTRNTDTNTYEVDMWSPTDENHWHKWFPRKEQAEAEYNKWVD